MDCWYLTHNLSNKSFNTEPSNSFAPTAIGAFLGAFAAFVFGLLTFYIQKKFERYWKHKNATVELEHLLDDNLNRNSANQYLLEGAIKTLTKHHMTVTLFTQLRLSEDITLRFGNLDLINKYFDYKDPAEKINHGMDAWQTTNLQLQQSVSNNPNLPAPIVHKNMGYLKTQAEDLYKFLKDLDNDTKYLLAYTRIFLQKDKHIWSLWLHNLTNPKKPFITKKDIKKEIIKLELEIDEISKKSGKRINKIIKG